MEKLYFQALFHESQVECDIHLAIFDQIILDCVDLSFI